MSPDAKKARHSSHIYPCRPPSRAEQLALVGLGLVVGIAPLAYGLLLYNYSFPRYGPAAADTWSIPWTITGICGMGVWLAVVFGRWLQLRYRVELFAEGVGVRSGLSGLKLYPWGELSGIANQSVQTQWRGKVAATRHSAQLFLSNGRRVKLDDRAQRFPELVARIKANLYPRRMSGYRAALRSGEWLTFGALAMHQQAGLHLKRRGQRRGASARPLPWDAIKQITVKDGRLVIDLAAKGAFYLPVGEVPNLELFLQLIREEV